MSLYINLGFRKLLFPVFLCEIQEFLFYTDFKKSQTYINNYYGPHQCYELAVHLNIY